MSAETLLELARKRFGDLTPADEKLFRTVAMGESADYRIGDEEIDKPANSVKWGDDRSIAANRIEWLCTDKQAKEYVTHRGISARGARIVGRLFLDQVDIKFWIQLIECVIPEEMIFQYSSVGGLVLNGSHSGPIYADGVKVAGGVYFRHGFRAEGEVRLLEAEVGGDLDFEGGQFSVRKGMAINVDGIKVAGHVLLRKGFKAEGRVNFTLANIGLGFICKEIDSATGMTLDLRSAKAGTFWDDTASWPDRGKLYLDGFKYERLYDQAPCDAKSRIEWLRRQPGDKFFSQPYEYLAKVLRESGHEREAKKILIAKNNDPARRKQLRWYQTVWYWIHRSTVAFGYRPEQALLWMLGFFIIGSAIFGIGDGQGYMRQLVDKAPTFNAFVYSLDTLLPIVDLQQEKYWFPASGFPASYLWVHIMAGWLLVSVFVAGLSRSVRS